MIGPCRVLYVFGNAVVYPVNDVTRTYLNGFTVDLIKWADKIASDVLCGLDENGKRDDALEICLQKIQQVFFSFSNMNMKHALFLADEHFHVIISLI